MMAVWWGALANGRTLIYDLIAGLPCAQPVALAVTALRPIFNPHIVLYDHDCTTCVLHSEDLYLGLRIYRIDRNGNS